MNRKLSLVRYRPVRMALVAGVLSLSSLVTVFSLPVGSSHAAQPQNAAASQPQDAAVERTRKQVRMLDGIYKNAIVLVTTHYVTEKSDLPAGGAFKKLFEVAKKEGWHEVRLLDATGDPYEPANAPETAFEKRAIKELVAGKTYVDEVVEKDGKRFLHAATAIPVVMKKCVMCHDNYANLPEGKAIGALGYTVPIE
ncbi:MAG: DUF3365 domain-containing protein [Pirellulaceae bacterium]|nr:DUF3365 domain-containing protein [Pirellulaceae bacterium]